MQKEKNNILIVTAILLGIAGYICVMLIFLLHEEPSKEVEPSQRQEARAPKKEDVTAIPAEALAPTAAEPADVKAPTSPDKLNLSNTQTTDAALARRLEGLTSLESLQLGATRITDAGLGHLKNLTALQNLCVHRTQVTDAGLAHLKGLTRLQSLCLHNTRISDASLAYLKNLTSLETLRLENTRVSDAGLMDLKDLTSLEGLYLGSTQITDAGLGHLKNLTALQRICVHKTQVTDAGLAHLKGLTRLQTLCLNDTQVSDAGLFHLKGMTSLRRLNFLGTKVSTAGLAELKRALLNCSISGPRAPVSRRAESPLTGKPAPSFTLKDLNGKQVSLSDFKDKVVLLDFWATWCGPCVRAIPYVESLHKKYKDQGLVVIGINNERDHTKVKAFAKTRMSYLILLDADKQFKEYGARSIPTAFYIDKEGMIRYRDVGFGPGKEKEMEQKIKELLGR
ncbi:MAG: redoxin family protein [Planctomycetota bacterium]|jgi:thiol-disulfide isomerase/thioredoxin